jgi:hypothetical protein
MKLTAPSINTSNNSHTKAQRNECPSRKRMSQPRFRNSNDSRSRLILLSVPYAYLQPGSTITVHNRPLRSLSQHENGGSKSAILPGLLVVSGFIATKFASQLWADVLRLRGINDPTGSPCFESRKGRCEPKRHASRKTHFNVPKPSGYLDLNEDTHWPA